jgi:hypothetical protein
VQRVAGEVAGEAAAVQTSPVGRTPEPGGADRGGAGPPPRGCRSKREGWPWAKPPQAVRLGVAGRPLSVVPAGEVAEPAPSGGRPSEPVRAKRQRVGSLPRACRSKREGRSWSNGREGAWQGILGRRVGGSGRPRRLPTPLAVAEHQPAARRAECAGGTFALAPLPARHLLTTGPWSCHRVRGRR